MWDYETVLKSGGTAVRVIPQNFMAFDKGCIERCGEDVMHRLDTIPAGRIRMANLAGVVQQLQKERDQAARTVEQLNAALAALAGVSGNRMRTRSRLSAAARARIAAAQRARWSKAREKSGRKQNVVSMPKRKTMSADARKKIAAAQRARWAKIKAARKKTA